MDGAHDSAALGVRHLLKQLHDLLGALAVETAGRLVQEQYHCVTHVSA